MDSYNNLKFDFDYRNLAYQRLPDPLFDHRDTHLLGEMYNDKMDQKKHDLAFLNIFQWKNFAWCFYKLDPGYWIPPHKDHFQNYSKFYKIKDKNKIKRAMVFLDDWKPGHVFGVKNRAIISWSAADYFTWDHTTVHWGGNFGQETRYTLQLTGTDDS